MLRGLRAAVLAVLFTALVAGCSTPAPGGSFGFVSPGGKTDLTYDPPADRGRIGTLAGPDLLTGQPLSVADLEGRVVVLNLWGQWCGPCRAEAADLTQVAEATRDLGVAFVGINVRDPQQDKAQDFVRDRGVTYPSIYDPTMRTLVALGASYPTSVIPSTIVLDREQRVAAIFLRGLLAEDLQPVVERVAAEPRAATPTSEPAP
ncbi:TlpA disulfide reductase family protein [Rhodococcus aerolatus]